MSNEISVPTKKLKVDVDTSSFDELNQKLERTYELLKDIEATARSIASMFRLDPSADEG